MDEKPTYEELEQRVNELEKENSDFKRMDDTLNNRIVALTLPLEDGGNIAFEDLFNIDDIQRIQDEFAKVTGVASIITHTDGTPITEPSNFCRLCKDIIRKTDKGLANCFKSDAVVGRFHPAGPIIQPCMSGGLWDAGAGITVGGRHIANWLIGQVRDELQTEDKMLAYAREIGASEKGVVEAFREVTAMSRERFGQIAKFLFILANQLSATAYQNVQQARFISERRRAEMALLESENKLRATLDATPFPTAVVDLQDDKILFWSLSALTLFGHTAPTAKEWYEIAYPDPDYRREVIERWKPFLETARGSGRPVNTGEYRVTCRDGSVRICELYATFLTDNLIVTFNDITEQKMMQEQFNQAQKMESVGRLAGGVAHDFNNMLGIILGYAELALDQLEQTDPLHANLQEIRKAANRSADLTRQLLAFARKQTIALKVLDLNATLEGMLKMLRRLIGENIDLAWLPGKNLWPVKLDPSQIDQILANLCVNARDSVADVGKVTIETGTVSFDETYCADHFGFAPGDYVMLAVSDNGCGMDKEILGNIFEPFFTTKEVGKGSGLGLATVYGIVKQNSGFINVYSEPDQGTTFRIYLPRHMETDERGQKSVSSGVAAIGNETILLVEDEKAILTMASMMLECLGYTVLTASSPDQAISISQSYSSRIDLLMTDVVMPEMSGRNLAEKLLQLNPNLKCLYMSGYTANVIAHHGVLDKGVHFIHKPFSKQDLAAKLREVLEDAKTTASQ